jgi:hypothetical protein
VNRDRPSTRTPQTRRGGEIAFRGVEYATEAALERALAEALVEAGRTGWKLTSRGAGYLAGFREAQRTGAA